MSKLDADEEFHHADSKRKPTKCSHLFLRFPISDIINQAKSEKIIRIFCKRQCPISIQHASELRKPQNTCPAGKNCIHELLVLL